MMRIFIGLIVAALLAGCASSPLSAVGRGASFNESTFGYVDARALRVKISLPEGFTLDVVHTRLVAVVRSKEGTRQSDLALEPITTSEGKRAGALWSKDTGVTTVEMDLTEESRQALRDLQSFVGAGTAKEVELQVKLRLKQVPPGATTVKVWVDMRMSPMEEYFPLIEGATIPISETKP
jgi:hypothetical protein